jgi:hypothetical protein
MYRPLSRRAFSKSSLVLPVALLADARLAGAQSGGATIGSTRAAFDAEYGASREDSGFTVYDFRHNQQAAYWVRFDANGFAEYIEIDFTSLPGGGLDFTVETAGTSRFVPTDAEFLYAEGNGRYALHSGLNVKQYKSASLAAATGRSGNLVVVDDFDFGPKGLAGPLIIERTYISLETWEVNPVTAMGRRPGIGDTLATWEAAYGAVMPAQGGSYLATPPLPGYWGINFVQGEHGNATSIHVELDTPISTVEAATWVSDMVKSGVLVSTYWLPPTPGGPIGLRIHVFNVGLGGYVFSVQYVSGGEETGTVNRIMLFASSPPPVY